LEKIVAYRNGRAARRDVPKSRGSLMLSAAKNTLKILKLRPHPVKDSREESCTPLVRLASKKP
jgi:hypothetical protein